MSSTEFTARFIWNILTFVASASSLDATGILLPALKVKVPSSEMVWVLPVTGAPVGVRLCEEVTPVAVT